MRQQPADSGGGLPAWRPNLDSKWTPVRAKTQPVGAKCLKSLVDLDGFEPSTSSMPWKRAPNCATGPQDVQLQYNMLKH